MKELLPKANLIAALINPDFPSAEARRQDILDAASRVGLKTIVVTARSETEFEPAFATAIEQRADALMVFAEPLFNSRRDQIATLAERYNCPRSMKFANICVGGRLDEL